MTENNLYTDYSIYLYCSQIGDTTVNIKNIFAYSFIFALIMMPSVMAANSTEIDSDGFNKLLAAPVTGVNYIMDIEPLEGATLMIVGLVMGSTVILAILSMSINSGRISYGGIIGKFRMMLDGRNWSIYVFLGFFGLLFALAMIKYVSTTSIF